MSSPFCCFNTYAQQADQEPEVRHAGLPPRGIHQPVHRVLQPGVPATEPGRVQAVVDGAGRRADELPRADEPGRLLPGPGYARVLLLLLLQQLLLLQLLLLLLCARLQSLSSAAALRRSRC